MMTNTTDTDRRSKLRKAAILVASLDQPLAQRLLADLPSRDAAEVRELAAQLKDVQEAEHRAVFADFREQLTSPPKHLMPSSRTKLEGVELDESLLAHLDGQHPIPTPRASRPGRRQELSGDPPQ